ncbi:Txe/YoeB family addiction module toxin [Chromatium okenii]|uniref:Putative mRNA interferase YoeB n=1 Tax=Chromatium okenii TaxID=61644 RepID=A0A2S7XMQ7_9GAMM|nr:Txe/YoeB family addiction module toxin [Chromatium okenii]PQJ95014.1 Txe/YoeB family addiction module toxin [Chromatium okenii]
MMYTVIFMTQAQKDAKNLAASNLKEKALNLINIIQQDPYKYPPDYEYLKGDMKGLISRRINKQHRLVYEVIEEDKIIKIYRMWTHYE